MRSAHMFKAAVAVAACSLALPTAADASTITCVGTTTLGPPASYTSSGGGDALVERLEITGMHDLCLADGTVVSAAITGTLLQVTHPDHGTGHVVVNETLSVMGGTVEANVRARFGPEGFDATVHVYGGTGTLEGMSGRGTTFPTGEGTFFSQIDYQYR